MRSLEIWDAGPESVLETFRRDLATAAHVAVSGRAAARLWHREAAGLGAGRFHRLPLGPAAPERRQTGGRIVPLGPGVLCCTLVLPPGGEEGWLDAGTAPRPEQVLNRALRPFLGVLRGLGLDAFYPGRDLVTVGGAPVLCAAFTVEADGILIIEQFLAVDSDFASLPTLLERADPDGVAGVDTAAFAGSVSVQAAGAGVPGAGWAATLGQQIARSFACHVDVSEGEPLWWNETHAADASCHQAFCGQVGALPAGHTAVAERSMLGIVEASADTRDGMIRELSVTGDLIAAAATVEVLASACEGLPVGGAELRRAVTRLLTSGRGFVLGVRDLAGLVERLR